MSRYGAVQYGTVHYTPNVISYGAAQYILYGVVHYIPYGAVHYIPYGAVHYIPYAAVHYNPYAAVHYIPYGAVRYEDCAIWDSALSLYSSKVPAPSPSQKCLHAPPLPPAP